MRVRTKFILLQLIIVGGFILSMTFVTVRFSQAYNLKQLELTGIESLTELKIFERKTDLFSSRTDSLDSLWLDWVESYYRFDRLYTEMLGSPYYRLLGDTAITLREARSEAWQAIKVLEIEPLVATMEDIISKGLVSTSGNLGINTSREVIGARLGLDSPEAMALAQVDSRFTNVRESLVASILIPTTPFIAGLKEQVEDFSTSLLLITIIITLIIQAGGALIGLRFSRRFAANVVLMEKTLARVASGNFNTNLEIKTRDEFQTIAEHFNILTSDLWNRIESMKDMMRDIGNATSEQVELGDLEDFMLELAIDNTGADAGFLMGIDDGMLVMNKIQGYFPPPMALPPLVASKREYVNEWFKTHHIAPGEGIVGQVLTAGEPRFVRSNIDGELPDNADPDNDLYINSAIFIPLTVSGAVLGVLALALTRSDTVFTDLDYAYMRSYGEFIALTIDNMLKYFELLKSHQINREIEVAADIQKTLLPEKMPVLNGVEAAAFSDAAKGVSGDYYDVFDLGEGKTAVVICDVAGKGVPAALLMIMIRTIIRSISSPEKRADQIMTELNRAVTGRLGADRFATISMLILDSKTGTVSYANGASYPLYILGGDTGRYRRFDADGMPLGIDVNAAFEHKKIRVKTKDYLIMFTDGLPEARNSDGAELTTERLLKVISRYADQSPRELARRVKDYLTDFTSGIQHDDQTFIALKVS